MSTDFIFPKNLTNVRIHFVGIKGTGMTALAEICVSRNAVLSGSDVLDRFYTDEILEKLGIKSVPFSAQNITKDIAFVVYSSAYKPSENPDLIEAQHQKIPIIKYTQVLGSLSATAYSCGICGVHGKTTVTGITGTLLKNLDIPVQVLAGSAVASFNGSCVLNKGHDYFVAETCEYQRNFMSFVPKKILLTGVESDHQDFFPTYESIRDAFVDYVLLLPPNGQLIYCADDSGAVETAHIVAKKRADIELIPYGKKALGDYKITFNAIKNGEQTFFLSVFKNTEFAIRIPGAHTLLNCAGAAALVCELVKTAKNELPDAQKLQKSFLEFAGSKRRSEVIGSKNGITFIDDYAHHPTAIKTTLLGIKEFYPKARLIVDFMAHTYSRTAALLEQFALAFEAADEVILHKIYASARETQNSAVSGSILYEKTRQNHTNVRYFEEIFDAESYVLSLLKTGDVFVTMGAGDNWKLGVSVLEKIGEKNEEHDRLCI